MLLVGASWLVHAWLIQRVPVPYILPDELIYLGLSRHLALGDGFVFHGMPLAFPTVLYPLLLVPAQSAGDPQAVYKAVQLTSSAFVCLAALPIYGLARRLLPAGWALAAAALSMVAPYVVYGHLAMTEGLFLFLSSLVVYLAVRAIAEPEARWKWALGLALGLTFYARPQGMLLAPVVLVAFLAVEAFRRGETPGLWRRMAAFWPAIAVFVAFVALHVIRVAVASPGANMLSPATYLGTYAGGLTGRVPFTWAHFGVAFGAIVGALGLGAGYWPLALYPAFVARAVRQGTIAERAFAAVATLTGAMLIALAAQNVALLYPPQVQERYCIYVAPWLVIGALVVLRAGNVRWGRVAGAVLALVGLSAAYMQRALSTLVDTPSYAAIYRVLLSLGWPGTTIAVSLACIAYAIVLGFLWARGRRRTALALALAYGVTMTGLSFYAQSTLSGIYVLRMPFVAWVAKTVDRDRPLVVISDGMPYVETTLLDAFGPVPIRQVYLEKPFMAFIEQRLTVGPRGELTALSALPDGTRILTGRGVALALPILARRGDVTVYEKRGPVRLGGPGSSARSEGPMENMGKERG